MTQREIVPVKSTDLFDETHSAATSVWLRRRLLLRTFQLWDGLTFVASLALAFPLSMPSREWNTRITRLWWPEILLALCLVVLWHWLFSALQLYESKRLEVRSKEYRDVLKAVTLGTAFLALGGVVFQLGFVTSAFVLTFWVLSSSTTIISRIGLRYVLTEVRSRGRNLRNVIIVGSGPRGQNFGARVEERPWLGYRVLGFVDDIPFGPDERAAGDRRILGTLHELPQLLGRHVIDEVFVSLPMKSSYERIQQVINHCEEQGISVGLLTDFFHLRWSRVKANMLDGIPVLTLGSAAEGRWRFAAKRIADLGGALALLALLSPLFLAVACLVKFTSPGAIFFRQERVGYKKRRFTLLKFRSMVEKAETLLPGIEKLNEATGPVFKVKDDPRLTKVGKFLRRTSIDELPQLINVLKGDMSLVGPRPLPLRDVEGFREDWQRRRFSVRPGMTCLWQVGGRSGISFDRWMELDLEYIDNWSLRLDLQILLRTVPAVLRGVGAH